MTEKKQYRIILYLALVNAGILGVLHIWLGLELRWYKEFTYFDWLTHFLGGSLIGFSTFWFWSVFLEDLTPQSTGSLGFMYRYGWRWMFVRAFVFVGVVFISVALGWELWEVRIGHMIEPRYLLDTSTDIVMGGIGSIVAYLISRRIFIGRSSSLNKVL
jgi:hypothetical protein